MQFRRNRAAAFALAALTVLSAAPAKSEDMRQGWSVQFRQDTFDETVVPVASISEDGDNFDKALIAVVCSPTGGLVAFFQPGLVFFDSAAKAQFKLPSGMIDAAFASGELPHLGKRLTMDEAASKILLDGFAAAANQSVAFRTEKKQGTFSSVGAAKAFEIVRQNCPH